MNKNAIILCSGGLDSVITAHYVKEKLKYSKLKIIFFDYEQRGLSCEEKCAKKCAKKINAKFIKIRLDFIKEISSSLINKEKKAKKIKLSDLKNSLKESNKYYVPVRNSIFLIYAMSLCESIFIKKNEKYDIFVGFKCEGKESYPDTTKEFVEIINKLSEISCIGKFKVLAPLIDKDKEDIIEIGKKLKVNFKDTFSCYVGKNMHCGTCLSCRLRQEGFYWANIIDPTKYKEKMNDLRYAK